MLLLVTVQTDASVISGSMQISFNNISGSSQYTIFYKHPSSVSTGSNFTVTLTLVVDDLRGLKSYLQDYTLTVLIPITPQHLISKSISVTAEKVSYLYPGGRWGPLNVSIPINGSSSGLSPGQTVSANVTIAFLGDVFYVSPVNYYYPEAGQVEAGQVLVDNVAQPLPFLPIVLIVLGGTMVFMGVLLRRR